VTDVDVSEEVKDEVAALTPVPASTDGWNQRRWAAHYREHGKALHARLVEVQTEAGIRTKVERLEEGPLFPHIDMRPFNPKADDAEREREKQSQRFGLRQLYFSVEDETLRKRLIRLERAMNLVALRFHEAERLAEHHEFAETEGRPRPWVRTATIEAVVAVLAGGYVGHLAGGVEAVRKITDGAAVQIGAVVGGVIGLIGAIRLRDLAQQMRVKEIADAREPLAETDRFYQSVLDEPEAFTSYEEFTGEDSDREA
jgi:hypothetical protein